MMHAKNVFLQGLPRPQHALTIPDRALFARFPEHLFQRILLPQALGGQANTGKMGQWIDRETNMWLTEGNQMIVIMLVEIKGLRLKAFNDSLGVGRSDLCLHLNQRFVDLTSSISQPWSTAYTWDHS